MIRFRLGINVVLSLLLLTGLAVAIALADFETEALKVIHEVSDFVSVYDRTGNESEPVEREDLTDLFDSSFDYISEEPEVKPKTAEAHVAVLPPDPDNAALLYYQAFLLCPELDAATAELRDKVLRGAEPDEKIRQYLKRCRKTIELVEAAAEIPECNWGILYSQGFGFNSLPLRHLTFLLGVDARIFSADGDYRGALGRCLTIRRLAGHVGDDTYFRYAVSVGLDGMALAGIRHILGCMAPDADVLTRLQGQLTAVGGAQKAPRLLEMDAEFMLREMRTNPKSLARLRDHLTDKAEDTSGKNKIRSLTDEELLVRARESYARFLDSVLRVLGSDMPYEKTYVELQRLTDKLKEQAISDPVIILSLCAGDVVKFYGLRVRHTANFNALRAAIEIYLEMANTGQLPDKLPNHLPKDPYSGQDFEYETTKEGFILRCRIKDIKAGQVQYEFKLQR